MVKKEVNNGVTRYVCEKCGKEMFAVFNDTNKFTKESEVLFKKYLNFLYVEGPYYSCQHCNSIHSVCYTQDSNDLDFKDVHEYQLHTPGE